MVQPGDRVRIQWGVDQAEATVIEIYGPPARKFAVLRLENATELGGPEEATVSFPVDELTVVPSAN